MQHLPSAASMYYMGNHSLKGVIHLHRPWHQSGYKEQLSLWRTRPVLYYTDNLLTFMGTV